MIETAAVGPKAAGVEHLLHIGDVLADPEPRARPGFDMGEPDKWSAWAWVSSVHTTAYPAKAAAWRTASTDRVSTSPELAS
jgi:hypothetical protein